MKKSRALKSVDKKKSCLSLTRHLLKKKVDRAAPPPPAALGGSAGGRGGVDGGGGVKGQGKNGEGGADFSPNSLTLHLDDDSNRWGCVA